MALNSPKELAKQALYLVQVLEILVDLVRLIIFRLAFLFILIYVLLVSNKRGFYRFLSIH